MNYFNMTKFEDNPKIYKAFTRYAREAKHKGFKNYSAKSLFEIIRWHTTIKGGRVFKIDNKLCTRLRT